MKFKKLASALVVAAIAAMFAVSTAFATAGTGTITISNSAKGETYAVYKLFDASVTGIQGGSIAYTGDIPESLSAYFTKDSAGNISAVETSAEMSADMAAALKEWTKTATATDTEVGTGGSLEFSGLSYGYYVITTTQGETAISVDSTNPNATVIDKNSTSSIGGLSKTIDDSTCYVGQTVTYTISFNTANYVGEDQIEKYTVSDTLPDFLANVNVQSITVGGTAIATQQFGSNKTMDIAWATNGENLYNNGAQVVITYTATVTNEAAIAGAGNQNTVTVSYTTVDEATDSATATAKFYTYAVAIQKVNNLGAPLAGAKFQIPFAVTGSNGVYTVIGEGTTVVETPADGVIIIKGVDERTLTVTETEAPAGYNKLTESFTVSPSMTTATTTNSTVYLDENGNISNSETGVVVTYTNDTLNTSVKVVVNKIGSTLPTTGGMGTTIIYIIGALMVAGAVVVLIARRRVRE